MTKLSKVRLRDDCHAAIDHGLVKAVLVICLLVGLSVAGADEAAVTPEASPPASATPQQAARFAILSIRPKADTLARWQPLIDYLNGTGPSRPIALVAMNIQELEAAVRERQVDFVLTQPAHYIQLTQREGLHSPLATLIGIDGGPGRPARQDRRLLPASARRPQRHSRYLEN